MREAVTRWRLAYLLVAFAAAGVLFSGIFSVTHVAATAAERARDREPRRRRKARVPDPFAGRTHGGAGRGRTHGIS